VNGSVTEREREMITDFEYIAYRYIDISYVCIDTYMCVCVCV